MCVRFGLTASIEKLKEVFHARCESFDLYEPNYNISPGMYTPVITSDKPNEIQLFRFGYTPSWSDKTIFFPNARAEGKLNPNNDQNYNGSFDITKTTTFRASIQNRRCLVLADYFFCIDESGNAQLPHLCYVVNRRPFAFAGVWDTWTDKVTGKQVPNFAIVTTFPNELMLEVNQKRTPVIISKTNERTWLNCNLDIKEALCLLYPIKHNLINAYAVSSEVLDSCSNTKELVKPIGKKLYNETSLIETKIITDRPRSLEERAKYMKGLEGL